MMTFALNILDMIGNTPLMRLSAGNGESDHWILAKCEFMNPTGSLKDRIVLEMIIDAEKRGKIKPGYSKLIEATSGNTGISLAAIGSLRGYEVVIVMTEDTNQEIQQLITHLGAKVVLTPVDSAALETYQTGEKPIYREKAARMLRNQITASLVKADPSMHLMNQGGNPANVRAHHTTGREILSQVPQGVDAFVAGIGTGGSLMGISHVLRQANPKVQIIGVEPAETTLDASAEPTIFGIQGVSDNIAPEILDLSIVDEILRIPSAQAWEIASRLACKNGLLVGPSSGANVWAALSVSEKIGGDKCVVTLLPDHAARYFSLGLFNNL